MKADASRPGLVILCVFRYLHRNTWIIATKYHDRKSKYKQITDYNTLYDLKKLRHCRYYYHFNYR